MGYFLIKCNSNPQMDVQLKDGHRFFRFSLLFFFEMTVVQINHGHLDRINDVCFDWSGERMATCSNDHHVKIWQKTTSAEAGLSDETNGDANKLPAKFANSDQDVKTGWINTHRFRAHDGAVWKLAWADPHFGQVSSFSTPWISALLLCSALTQGFQAHLYKALLLH